MDAYWIIEYGKVFSGYIFLMFVWPLTVFWPYLRNKTKTFRFSFCVTVQIIIINMVVLMMGLFHILDTKIVACLFYGVFVLSVWQRGKRIAIRCKTISDRQNLKMEVESWRRIFWEKLHSKVGEYIVIFVVVAFGMAYFSYGAFQMHSYGQNDVFTHHEWVSQLVEGVIFSNGVYPQAMHSFIYCLYALFGIRIYSIMLFLQCVHVMVFFLSAYSLLREVFGWRYTPVFVLGLYLTLDFAIFHSMSRLQTTLPMEFGLHTQFLCAMYLVRYLRNTGRVDGEKKLDDLLLFTTALSASIAIHYYTTIMAFIMCGSFAVFKIKEIVRSKHLISLVAATVCGCIIAVIPMVGALVSGIPFEGSINWALTAMENTNTDETVIAEGEAGESDGPLALSADDLAVIEKLPDFGQKIVRSCIKIEYFCKAVFQKGYKVMYWNKEGGKRGECILGLTIFAIVLCFLGRCRGGTRIRKISKEYPPVILISIISMFIFVACEAPELGLPVIIADHRFGSTGHLMTMAVLLIPVDALFSIMASFCKDCVMKLLSCAIVIGIYVFTNLFNIFHEYMFYVLFRYESTVSVTESIMEEFPRNSYTIVSPREEAYQIASNGKHEEISSFIKKCDSQNYTLPTKYVFLYVEKKPLVYFQYFYPDGPAWLAKSRNYKIETTEISEEAAGRDFIEERAIWDFYIKNRTVLESKAYEWCQNFSEAYSDELKVYYEDDDFVCFYFQQDPGKPYNLSVENVE